MNTYNQAQAISLPTLPPEWVKVWMEETQDLVLLLDDTDTVEGFFQGGGFSNDDLYHWLGQNLADFVSADSSPKLAPLLNNDASSDNLNPSWRHINLLGKKHEMIPVLAKCLRLPENGAFKAVFCRDLRSLQEANNKFLAIQQNLECVNQSLRDRLQSIVPDRSLKRTLDTYGAVQMMKNSTHVEVIKEMVIYLERQCVLTLLEEAEGDHFRAARLIGLNLTEWQEKMALLQNQKTH